MDVVIRLGVRIEMHWPLFSIGTLQLNSSGEMARERIGQSPIGRFAPGSELARERKGSVPENSTWCKTLGQPCFASYSYLYFFCNSLRLSVVDWFSDRPIFKMANLRSTTTLLFLKLTEHQTCNRYFLHSTCSDNSPGLLTNCKLPIWYNK